DDARAHDVIAGGQARNRVAEPAHSTVRAEREIGIAGGMQTCGTGLELERKRLLRSRLNGLRIRAFRSGNEREPETGQLPDMMSFYEDITIHTDFSFQHRILSQALHEHRCPAINKAFR